MACFVSITLESVRCVIVYNYFLHKSGTYPTKGCYHSFVSKAAFIFKTVTAVRAPIDGDLEQRV